MFKTAVPNVPGGRQMVTTAMADTHVSSGFHVHECLDAQQTVALLVQVTRRLRQRHARGPPALLTMPLPWHVGSKDGPPGTLSAHERHVFTESPGDQIEYEAFKNAVRKKNHYQVASAIFGRMMTCINGVSGGIAHAVLLKHPTVAALRRSYSMCATERERELLLAPLNRIGRGKRIGPVVSKRIYEQFCK